MKIQIRTGIFETNSSSTHSLIISTEQEFKDWEKGMLYLKNNSEFQTREEVIAELRAAKWIDTTTLTDDEVIEEALDNDWNTYESFDDCYLESFEEHFTTPSGDKMVAFGQYGYDG